MMKDMGIHAIIGYMLEMKGGFDGFDSLSLTVSTQGKKLNIRSAYNRFSVSIKDNRILHPNDEEMYE